MCTSFLALNMGLFPLAGTVLKGALLRAIIAPGICCGNCHFFSLLLTLYSLGKDPTRYVKVILAISTRASAQCYLDRGKSQTSVLHRIKESFRRDVGRNVGRLRILAVGRNSRKRVKRAPKTYQQHVGGGPSFSLEKFGLV